MHSQQLVLNKGNWETFGDDLLAPQLILAMGDYGKITDRKNFMRNVFLCVVENHMC